MLRFFVWGLVVFTVAGHRLGCDNGAMFDLSFQYDESTVHWPTTEGFKFSNKAFGNDSNGNWYAANDFCMGEHAGTHLDAPYHFSEHGWTITDIPLSKLVTRGYVLDFESLGHGPATVNTTLEVQHIQQFERHLFGTHGRLPIDSILLVRFNWAQYYGTPKYYNLRTDSQGQMELSFPGLSPEACKLLVDRRVAGVAVDSGSMDPGSSKTFDAHRILYTANIYGLENVNIPADLSKYNDRLMIYALPMKTYGGTGAPCRVLAVVPKKSG